MCPPPSTWYNYSHPTRLHNNNNINNLQVELMQGKHMVLQLDKKPPASYLGADGDDAGRPVDMAVVLRVEALDQEGLLHRLVDRIRAMCKGQAGHDDDAGGGDGGGGGGGARLEQYGLRGHTGSAIMEFLIAGAKVCSCFSFVAGGRGEGGWMLPSLCCGCE